MESVEQLEEFLPEDVAAVELGGNGRQESQTGSAGGVVTVERHAGRGHTGTNERTNERATRRLNDEDTEGRGRGTRDRWRGLAKIISSTPEVLSPSLLLFLVVQR